MTITFGNQLQVDSVGTFSTIIQMTSTTAICFYSSASDAVSAKHLTLSGSDITAGAALVIDSTATATTYIRAARLTNTLAMVAYFHGSTHRARIVTVSGTTLSVGGIRNLTDNTNIDFASMSSLGDGGQVIYCYSDSSSQNGKARILTNFGGTPLEGAAFTYDSNCFNSAVVAFSATKAVIVFGDGSNSDVLTGEVLNIAATTITGNADQTLSASAVSQSTTHRCAIDSLDSSRVIIAWNDGTNAKTRAVAATESGNALIEGETIIMSSSGSANNLSVAATSDSLAIVSGNGSGGIETHELNVSGTIIELLDSEDHISGGSVFGAWIAAMSEGIGISVWDASIEAIPVFASGSPSSVIDINIENSTNLILNSIEGDGDRGGWQANASFANDQDEATYGRRVDIYWTPEGDGVWANDPILAITGSIIPQSVRFDIRQSGTTFVVVTTDNFLASAGLQGIYFTDTDSPTNPHQYADLRLGTTVRHIIEQHTNISSTANVQDTDGTDTGNPIGGWVDTSNIDVIFTTKIDAISVRQSNALMQAIKKIAANEFYVAYMSKDDKFNYTQHPVFKTVLDPFTLAIDADMIVGQPEVQFRDRVDFDQVVLAALTDNGEILRAKFPANITARGRRKNITGLRCNDQNRLDNLAVRVFSFETRVYNIKLQLPGASGLYLELFDRVSFTYTGTARNGVSLSFTDEPFFVNKIRVTRVGNFGAITELDLEQENIEGAIYA